MRLDGRGQPNGAGVRHGVCPNGRQMSGPHRRDLRARHRRRRHVGSTGPSRPAATSTSPATRRVQMAGNPTYHVAARNRNGVGARLDVSRTCASDARALNLSAAATAHGEGEPRCALWSATPRGEVSSAGASVRWRMPDTRIPGCAGGSRFWCLPGAADPADGPERAGAEQDQGASALCWTARAMIT
ncbi:hypothetical protein MHUMG1_06686 [Metarhizium humberi]|uniref:Uncharacterized protein n=1 Tax=Metarhizium humberi TaxID=2596975 RepID=A0A9P8M6H2_9HYPO|nr:hypothetical protein MHUMG1_06686 [Metarhizium humberi]